MSSPALPAAYGRAAAAWAAGPDPVLYDDLAEALVAACPRDLRGARLLDLGAGTGAASRAAVAAGSDVVATDLAGEMLAHDARARPPGVAADARRLPFADATFDGVLAAFLLNHLPEPARALAEAGRVTRPGGFVVASTFRAGWDHPVKQVVDGAAARAGFTPPTWYVELKSSHAPRAGDPDALAAAARAAGLTAVRVMEQTVDVGVRSARELVAWRLGMAHLHAFVAGLGPDARRRLAEAAARQLPSRPARLRPELLLLTARVPGPAATR